MLRRHFYSEYIVTERHRVEIECQQFIFIVYMLQPVGNEYLPDFGHRNS